MKIRRPVGLIAIAALGLMPAHAQEDIAHPTVRLPLKPDAVPDKPGSWRSRGIGSHSSTRKLARKLKSSGRGFAAS